jgi:hypothetical protein
MTIEIRRPELEALIQERMKSGGFQSIEDVLLQALKSSGFSRKATVHPPGAQSGADLVAAMQASPYKEIAIEPTRHRLPVRDVVF